MAGRSIFIGDVHGCLIELQEMIDRLEVGPQDEVILLGDLINRGPDSVGVVQYVREQGFLCLRGNHEDDYLNNFTSGRYARLKEDMGAANHAFLEQLPLFIRRSGIIAVHAGLAPGMAVEETPPEILLNIRTYDSAGQTLNNFNHPAWHSLYHGSELVVYGHWARQGLRIDTKTIGLDSGCVYGRKLSAWISPENQIVQVQARQAYYIPPALRQKVNSNRP